MSPLQEYSKVTPLFMSPFLVKATVVLFHASHLGTVKNVTFRIKVRNGVRHISGAGVFGYMCVLTGLFVFSLTGIASKLSDVRLTKVLYCTKCTIV